MTDAARIALLEQWMRDKQINRHGFGKPTCPAAGGNCVT